MGIFRRGGPNCDAPEKASVADVGELLLQGHGEIQQTAAAYVDRLGLGTECSSSSLGVESSPETGVAAA
jgi:hypothetical protein